MTRRTSKHGTVYTEGSHATPAAGYPNTCAICSQRILTSRQSFQHHWENNAKHAWHTTCPPPWRETTMSKPETETEATEPEPAPDPEPEPDNGDDGEDG